MPEVFLDAVLGTNFTSTVVTPVANGTVATPTPAVVLTA